ncbi:hypothetical protein [uncultured Microbacterium sp.]|uniref:hypothetical protein n=1 Tax=uncultured Microbacterium sp. TaxID=191216 RepID=UPI0025DFBD76|nr:hypothetical protein [uncultured Microbacterium sp.]
MPSTAEHIAARDDADLRNCLIAAAEQAGIQNAQPQIDQNMGLIVAATVTVGDQETSITRVHAYAAGQYQAAIDALPPRPGLNPAAVTDPILTAAVQAILEPASVPPSEPQAI